MLHALTPYSAGTNRTLASIEFVPRRLDDQRRGWLVREVRGHGVIWPTLLECASRRKFLSNSFEFVRALAECFRFPQKTQTPVGEVCSHSALGRVPSVVLRCLPITLMPHLRAARQLYKPVDDWRDNPGAAERRTKHEQHVVDQVALCNDIWIYKMIRFCVYPQVNRMTFSTLGDLHPCKIHGGKPC